MTGLLRCIVVLLMAGLCHIAVEARPRVAAKIDLSGRQAIKPLDSAHDQAPGTYRRGLRTSGSGIAGYLFCNQVEEASYTDYDGIYITEDYVWFWVDPEISYEETQTVLHYSVDGGSYFYFQVENGADRLEGIKIYLDKTRTNNAQVSAVYLNETDGYLYYTNTYISTDYENGVMYWHPDSEYELDNLFFYLESGELNVIGFEIYSTGNTPEGFLPDEVVVAPPTFNPPSCSFSGSMTVEILAEEGNQIYYRTDGIAPRIDEQYKYAGPVVISSTTYFTAIAVDGNGNASNIATATYENSRHGIGEGYDPESPGNPGMVEEEDSIFHLTVVANPTGAGSVYANNYDVRFGDQTYVYCYSDNGFEFENWTIEGTEVSTASSFYYVMPDHDVTIVANYRYDPQSPGDPSPLEQKVTHPVSVRAIPSGAASFSPSGLFDMEESTTRYVYAYPDEGWKLVGWTLNGEQLPQTTSPIEITMEQKALDIAAYFTYSPSSPVNPGANYYNSNTGQVIIDDFTAGDLYDAIRDVVGYDNFANVSSIIVKGTIEDNDMGIFGDNYFTAIGTIDLSRTGGVDMVPSYAFSSSTASSIILPSTVSRISSYAFRDCSNLTSITVYAQVPPVCSSSTFSNFTNKDNCTIFVPAESIELYSAADYWKDFVILPIANDAHVLEVNLPEECADGRYKNNTIEIVNVNTGVRQRYVVSDRLLYTFNGLQKDEQYNVYLWSQAGLEIGRIENVTIPDQDISVTFESLRQLRTVAARVETPDGADVTGDVTIEWLQPLDDGTQTYLRKTASLGDVPDGQRLVCRVTLGQQTSLVYANPDDVEFTVGEDTEVFTITLSPLRSVTLSGMVVDGDGAALQGATVSISQTLNGKYSKSYTAATDRQGRWSAAVLDAPETWLTYAATECINVNDTVSAFAADVTSLDMGTVTLRSIVGARITYGFTYRAAGISETEADSYYPDYQNVAVSVYDVTQNRALPEISLQYPLIVVLDEAVAVGDELRLVATSKTGDFNPIERTVVIGEDQRAEVTFDIVGKGGIAASFEMAQNPTVVGMLYDAAGELLEKGTYTEAAIEFTGLDDGDYTLVTMGQSDLMNSVLRLSGFDEIGLTEGRDYVKNAVAVKSGEMAQVEIAEVPAFDESLFYYTNSSASFSANKSSITTGNYLTLRSTIDFKQVYKQDISNVALVVDLPANCDLVEQSVIQGPNLLPYTIDNGRLTVQLGDNYTTQVRFCVVPTAGGQFNATGSVSFSYGGKAVTQPIGTASSQVKDLEISVPSVIASPEFTVTGVAPAQSKVNVYSDGTLLGTTKANGTGAWSAECALVDYYNLSTHNISAVATTEEGTVLQTETESITYDAYVVKVKTVTMSMKSINIVWDFENNMTDRTSYTYTSASDATFVIDLTDNSREAVSGVSLYVFTNNNEILELPAAYDEKSGHWYVTRYLDSNSLPVNMSAIVFSNHETYIDRGNFDELYANIDNERIEVKEMVDSITVLNSKAAALENSMEESQNILEGLQERINLSRDEEEIDALLVEFMKQVGFEADVNDYAVDYPDVVDVEYVQSLIDKANELLDHSEPVYDESIINELCARTDALLSSTDEDVDYDNSLATGLKDTIQVNTEKGIATIYKVALSEFKEDLSSVTDTVELQMTDKSAIYVYMDESNVFVVDSLQQSVLVFHNTEEIVLELKNAVALFRDDGKDFLSAMNEARHNIETFKTSLLAYVKAVIDKEDKKLKDWKKLEADLKSERIVLIGQSAGKKMKIEELTKEIKRLSDPDLIPLEDYFDIVEKDKLITQLKDEREKVLRNLKATDYRLGRVESKLGTATAKIIAVSAVLGTLYDLYNLGEGIGRTIGYIVSAINDYNQWHSLINKILPCENDYSKALALKEDCEDDWSDIAWRKGYYPAFAISGVSNVVNGYMLYNRGLKIIVQVLVSVLTEYLDKTCEAMYKQAREASVKWYPIRYAEYYQLQCKSPQDKDKPNKPKNPGNFKDVEESVPSPTFQPLSPIIDPAGFVYEAVPSNRVEGVQASIYYKETKEDMYGDPYEEVVLWDAEEYAQQNPLFTDENGMYRWDVPQGLWQVKFEKDGYLTAYSEWLPVPPPQLEVNIPITQNRQPEVVEAHAYEAGVEVQFDKFMDLATLTTGNIYVTANGEKLTGTIELIDSELADEYADEADVDATRYASRVRFVPEQALSSTTGEVRLTVSRNVLSYAGIPMTEDYSQALDVEKEVSEISAEETVKVLYGGEKELTVYAIPYDAAVGRTLRIANSSPLIASVDTTEVVLDEEGKATIIVGGELPGRSQLTFSIDDVTATGTSTIDVVTEIIMPENPKASRASGTAVYRGTTVALTTDTKDGVIYFTTDGTCPCDENGTRRKYTVPIVIDDDMEILAMTQVGTDPNDVSEIVQFNYTLKRTDMDYALEEGWSWVSHNLETAASPADFAEMGNVERILSQTQEVVNDPKLGFVGTLTEMTADKGYKVETSAAAASTVRLSDVAWNPATPIEVVPGWNWIGYPVSQTMTVDEAFEPTAAETLDMVVGQNGFAQFDGENWVGTLQTLSPGMGYMYQSQSGNSIVYNTSIVSRANALYAPGISATAPLAVDIHKYPQVMCFVGVLADADGFALDAEDYQVAAFCGSECRGVGKVVDGKVMMSVYGNAGDKISLQVVRIDDDMICATSSDVLAFGEKVVGNLFDPYVITVGKSSGMYDASLAAGRKVYLVGDVLYVDGVACIDGITLFDTAGNKALSSRSIPDGTLSVAQLVAGVYVVVVDADGNYSYHKIVIR